MEGIHGSGGARDQQVLETKRLSASFVGVIDLCQTRRIISGIGQVAHVENSKEKSATKEEDVLCRCHRRQPLIQWRARLFQRRDLERCFSDRKVASRKPRKFFSRSRS